MVSGVHPDSPAAHSGGYSVHRGLHIRLLRPDLRTHLQASGQQMDHWGVKLRCFDKLSNHRACTQQQFVENKYLTGNYLNNPAPQMRGAGFINIFIYK